MANRENVGHGEKGGELGFGWVSVWLGYKEDTSYGSKYGNKYGSPGGGFKDYLGGGFENVLFSPLLGEDFQFD